MRNFALTLMASLLSCSAVSAFWPEATDSLLEVGVGYRQDKLEWKTGGHFDSSSSSSGYGDSDYNGYGPGGVHSHLEWKNLSIWEIELRGKYVTCDNVYLRASADYGWITSGKNVDKDRFEGIDYFEGSLRSHSKAKGHVYDAKFAVGYQFKLCDDSFGIVPLVGYSWHGQHLKDGHAKNSNSSSSSYFESVDGYSSNSNGGGHSKYNTRWAGPFIGFDFDYRFGCCCEYDIFGTYEFHWAEYHAKAKWDRPELIDGFHHHAKNAYGSVFDIGVKWDFCECWTASVRGEFQWFWADHGRDRAKIAEARLGGIRTDCHLTIPLKDIKWQSAAVIFDLGMVF